MPSLRHTIKMLKIPLLQDGVISLGETSLLQRAVRPFVQRGDATACELRDLLLRVRQDGVITSDESRRICALLDRITDGGVQFDQYVHRIPDFPSPGVNYCDISRLLDTPWLFRQMLDVIAETISDTAFDLVAAPAAGGLAIGAAVAVRCGAGFVPVRAPGKLPRETVSEEFGDETRGRSVLQMHADAVMRGERVVVVSDVLATGETSAAVARLVKRLGGQVVKMVFPVEIESYGARAKALAGYDVFSLVKFAE